MRTLYIAPGPIELSMTCGPEYGECVYVTPARIKFEAQAECDLSTKELRAKLANALSHLCNSHKADRIVVSPEVARIWGVTDNKTIVAALAPYWPPNNFSVGIEIGNHESAARS